MSERSRVEPWATQMEALAAFMGWQEERWQPDKGDGAPRYQWFDGEVWPDASGPWNPFEDARADYALLVRAREVYGEPPAAWDNPQASAFFSALQDAALYEPGHYAHAVLESLATAPTLDAGEP